MAIHPQTKQIIDRNIQRMKRLESWSKRHHTVADRAADLVAAFCGTMGFVWIHAALFAAWIAWNVLPGLPHFDAYPFTFLTLCVSLEAIFLSSFILISQNREMRMTERRAQIDLQINLLAEQETTKILHLVHGMARKLGTLDADDPEVAALAEAVRPEIIALGIEEAYRHGDAG